jgi:hypothetical protein
MRQSYNPCGNEPAPAGLFIGLPARLGADRALAG